MGSNQSNGAMDQDADVIMCESNIDIELPSDIFDKLNLPEMDPPKNVPVTPQPVDRADGHIYLIREREFIARGLKVYKIGKSSQSGLKRAGQYSKNSVIEIHLRIPDYHSAERELIAAFKLLFIHRKDIGNEYFEGESDQMVRMIYECRARRCHATPPLDDKKLTDDMRKSDESVFVLERAFQELWQHLRRIVSDEYYSNEMYGAFLEHMIFLITGPRCASVSCTLPVSHDRPAPVVNLDNFRKVLSKMYTPGPKNSITRDQYRRYVGIYNLVTSAHLLVIQYESARMVTTRPNRYPEIKMTAALAIPQSTVELTLRKCIDGEYIKVTNRNVTNGYPDAQILSDSGSTTNRRRSRTG